MSYLEQLKRENMHPHPLPKLPKGGYDSFDSDRGWQFSEKTPKATPEPRKVETTLAHPLEAAHPPTETQPIRQVRVVLNEVADLPEGCPLRQAGGRHPDGCRFDKKLLARLIGTGTLKLGGPCPVRRACKIGGAGNG